MTLARSNNRSARVPYDDLREWIVEAEKLGELVRARGYSWQEDIGMAAELLQHDARAPAALFDEIPGYPKGFRILTNFFGGRRQNMTLGFSPELNKIELSESFLKDFQQICDKPLPCEVVDTGPVMENVIEGDAVDVTMFPPRSGTIATRAAVTSAPAASTSPAIPRKDGSTPGPIGS
jgi:4-hydroxy-3-polyprenylbenzoate decarboxylase